jgi:hypothetical protein
MGLTQVCIGLVPGRHNNQGGILNLTIGNYISRTNKVQITLHYHPFGEEARVVCTFNSTSHYTLWTLYRSYFKASANMVRMYAIKPIEVPG